MWSVKLLFIKLKIFLQESEFICLAVNDAAQKAKEQMQFLISI